ncbi:hypothetical protein Pst134EA_026942 [Puccinia striiformis f. sp. tritici]|uniref:hypothetical protein n=1 Tax=Puccinia striiformis f. sp. tritici TaxID=168172 RepID=UPI002008AEE1|nr:hypothetical protein Pst134EA_026942 [Puccinia striiformis f. sp. tritici]KAH9450234.1 hypothetical protein Pst134EA_026942 [Puccinia striiformis f. sp. tritici]
MNAYNCHFLSLLVLLTLNWTGKIGSILAPSLKRPPSFSPAFREPNYGFGESRELKFNSVSPLTKKARLADHRVDLPFPVEIPEAPRLATRPLLAGNPVQNPDLSIAEISGQGDIGARKLSLDHTGATTSTDQLSRHKGHPLVRLMNKTSPEKKYGDGRRYIKPARRLRKTRFAHEIIERTNESRKENAHRGLMTMEDWMIQQIRVCSARYSRILDSYSSLRLSHLEPNEVHGMTQEWNAGAPVVMSTIKLEGGRVRSLNWIVNKDRSDCAVGQLNIRFMSLIHLITCYHSELLKVMGIDPSQIRSQNEALIKWLLAEIFNPSTGFPIIGWAADQSEQAEGEAKQGSPLRDLDKILSIHLSRSDRAGPNPGAAKVVDLNDSTTACILINYWYRSEQSQFFQEKFSNDQHHLMSLLRQIQMKLSVPNHPFSYLKGLPQ